MQAKEKEKRKEGAGAILQAVADVLVGAVPVVFWILWAQVDPLPTLCATLVTFAHKAPLALSRNLALRGHILEPLAALLRARV